MLKLDSAKDIDINAHFNTDKLFAYLKQYQYWDIGKLHIQQFKGGYSNLTYLLSDGQNEWVLRRPPHGVQSASAHNMSREYHFLKKLYPVYQRCPEPLFLCEDEAVMGASFYVMNRIQGVILRHKLPSGISQDTMQQLSERVVDCMVALHNIDVEAAGLSELGNATGYLKRQVDGWAKRYERSMTDEIPEMFQLSEWLKEALPSKEFCAVIHNDFKYDNIVLDPANIGSVKAVLDWEMATIGDPLSDLGTTLAYWVEANEEAMLRPFNLSWAKGNLSRQEFIRRYMQQTKLDFDLDDILFHYVLGLFKIGVIAQQIYWRYKNGYSKDKRFESMNVLVKIGAQKAIRALEKQKI